MHVRGLCCLTLLAVPLGAVAQEPMPLTLDAARRLAVEQSAILAARTARSMGDRSRAQQLGAWPNPVVSVRIERTGSGAQAIDQWTAEVGQPVDLAGVAASRGAAARLRAEGSAAAIVGAEAGVLMEVSTAYARAILADRRVRLADLTVAAFDRAARIGRERRDAGDLSGLALRRLDLEAGRVLAQRAVAHLARRTERGRLAELISGSARSIEPEQIILVDTLPDGPGPLGALDSLISVALRERPDVIEQNALVGAATTEARAELRLRLPVPVLTAGLKSEQLGSARQSGFVAGVALPLPVFDRRRAAVAAGLADREETTAVLEQVRRRVRREVTLAWESLHAVESQRAALAPRLGEDARIALSAAEVAFNEGEIGVTEWLDTIRAYYEAEATLLSLIAETTIERTRLEMAVGQLGRLP